MKCSGKLAGEDLQDLTAQVRKFVVRSFILKFRAVVVLRVGKEGVG